MKCENCGGLKICSCEEGISFYLSELDNINPRDLRHIRKSFDKGEYE